MIPYNHFPGLFLATTFTFGGMIPLFNEQRAMREFGLPERIVASREAQSVMIVYSGRMTMVGMLMYYFYGKGQYAAIDAILASLAYAGMIDGYVCWREGARGSAIFRLASSVLVAGLGAMGVTAWKP